MGRPRGWTRLYVRNWRVRTKLAAVLLVPSVAFVAVGGLELYTAFRASQDHDHYADRVALSREVTDLVHQLQQERDRTAGAVVAADRTAAESTAVGTVAMATADDRRLVNETAASYRRAARPVGDRLGGAFRTRVDEASSALEELTALRTAADQGQLRNDAVFDGYSRVIATLLRVLPDIGAGDAALEQSLRGLSDLVQAKELQSQVRGRLQAIAQAGGFALGEYQEFADLRARRDAAVDRFRTEAEPAQLSQYEDQVKGAAALAANRLERTAADRSRLSGLGFNAEQWWLASTNQQELLRQAEREFVDDAVHAAELFSAEAGQRAQQVAAAVAAILLIALVTSLVVGRSMAGSLRRLRRRALVVAQRDLPEAIRRLNAPGGGEADLRIESMPIESADEIGEVAEAFEAVHQSAVRLATDQAALRRDVSAMFINLARRSQVLVGRQLQLLDELEADEQDPDRLARFFVLDHLATRMRRNDENLLVLAASESHRLWREPVPLYRLLLGAVAETDQYERIEASGPDDVVVPGHVVPDLMHLLAELLDNATTFSPPTTTVALVARMVRSGEAGTEAIITVEDRGMGMTPGMLAEANGRLAQPAAIDVAVSERMGHFVVSHLAARHGMRVELRGAPGGGVTASVTLPTPLLTPVPAAAPAKPEPAPREWSPEVSLETTQPLAALIAADDQLAGDVNGASGAGSPDDTAAGGVATVNGTADAGGAAAGAGDEVDTDDGTSAGAGAARIKADAGEPGRVEAETATRAGDGAWVGTGAWTGDGAWAGNGDGAAAGVGLAGADNDLVGAGAAGNGLADDGADAALPRRTNESGLPSRPITPLATTANSTSPDRPAPTSARDANSGLPTRSPGTNLPSRGTGSALPTRSGTADLPSRSASGLPTRPGTSGLPSRPSTAAGSSDGGNEAEAGGRAGNSGGSDSTGGWWSGDGTGWRAGMLRLPEPVEVETNPAGLPVRVPMAAFPHGPEAAAKSAAPAGPGSASASIPVADPDEVADALARFHSGIRLADDEDAGSYPN